MLLSQAHMITTNETTNERNNWARYDYMIQNQKFFNPYNKGPSENWKNFMLRGNIDPPILEMDSPPMKTSIQNHRPLPMVRQLIDQVRIKKIFFSN